MNGEWRTTTNGEVIELEIDTKSCKGTSQEINYIEHVQAYISEFILIELPESTNENLPFQAISSA